MTKTIDSPQAAQLVEIITMVKDKDWTAMLELVPEGVEHRTWKFTQPWDFTEWDTYEDYSRYVAPAQQLLIEKCLDKMLDIVQS